MNNLNRRGPGAALALITGMALAAAPDGKGMGHGRVRPGMFPGITFHPDDSAATTTPAPSGEAKDLNEAITLFVKAREDYHAEIKRFGDTSTEMKANMEALQDKLGELEVKGKRPGVGTPGAAATQADESLEAKAFNTYMRRGEDRLNPAEVKALTSDSDSDGGFLVPTNTASQITKKLIEVSPIRELATVISISAGDSMEFPVEDDTDFGGGWVAERGSRAETAAGKIRMAKITAHEMYANPFISQKLLDDNAYNVDSWLNDRVSIRLAKIEGAAFVGGDAVDKPQGILTTAAGLAEVVSGSATLLTADAFYSVQYALPEYYTKMATWLMKRATIGAARLLKDLEGRYVWQPGLQTGDAPQLCGSPYREVIDMPDVAAGTFPVAYGDWKACYYILDRQGIRVLRDPYSSKPFIEFYTTKRTGGAVVLKAAARKMKISI